jgi:hypothetical protein
MQSSKQRLGIGHLLTTCKITRYMGQWKKCFARSFWTTWNNLLETSHGQHTWQFHKQCDYLFRFQVERKISESILLLKWPKNVFDTKDDAYETTIFTYNRELDLLISASNITKSDVEEESSPPYPEDSMTNSEEEATNSEDTTLVVTL